MPDLFNDNMKSSETVTVKQPLADRLRPQSLSDIAGQDHLTGPDGSFTTMLEKGIVPSMILWGPPGCGKTTIARILARESGLHYETLSAIFSGVGDLRKVFDAARHRKTMGKGTLLFVDEIHRFNKSQQDAFLPVVEDGTITLIGATTENPSFEVNGALLSRCQVFILNRLDEVALEELLQKAEVHKDKKLPLTKDARDHLKAVADGDGRYLLSLIDHIFNTARNDNDMDIAGLSAIIQKRSPLYDKSDEGHYNLISALHKSVRGSDPDAALYWFCRMLDAGEDPHYLARRLVRMATEDIGLALPQALTHALAAWETYERLGSPEGELALANTLVFMATAPKSNAVYSAYKGAMKAAKSSGSLMPPKHILNAPTKFMKNIGYGTGYVYDHDTDGNFSGQNYFPDEMPRQDFYNPKGMGYEYKIKETLDDQRKKRKS